MKIAIDEFSNIESKTDSENNVISIPSILSIPETAEVKSDEMNHFKYIISGDFLIVFDFAFDLEGERVVLAESDKYSTRLGYTYVKIEIYRENEEECFDSESFHRYSENDWHAVFRIDKGESYRLKVVLTEEKYLDVPVQVIDNNDVFSDEYKIDIPE